MKKIHLEASKVFVDLAFLLAFGFVIFCCYEVHRLEDLSPISYLGGGVLLLLGLVVKSYMQRAAAKDLSELKMKETAELSKIKHKYGEDYQEGQVEIPDLNI